MNSLQYQTSWSASNDHWIPVSDTNTPDDSPNAVNAPIIITPARNPQKYPQQHQQQYQQQYQHQYQQQLDLRPRIQTDLLQSADTSLDRPHSPASYTLSASPTASSYIQCPSPHTEKFKLNINHQDENGNNDTRVMYFWPDEDTFASLIPRIQRKLNEDSINRLKYLNADGIEIVVGDDEDLNIALSSQGDKPAAHSFWTMRRNESL
ncbi:hypothetical protein INT43_007599 [Umbelopsis isabellina]|uniref:PB1 domain-containing protein n=1 Tax=Mortierella isabellina TaxID=91625 RepID=A0A8H7UBM2_MORIS|nr:hypothetical protein INT43_007599 [Umbelopsis isabellina]